MVPDRGIEPLTYSVSRKCSTAELIGQNDGLRCYNETAELFPSSIIHWVHVLKRPSPLRLPKQPTRLLLMAPRAGLEPAYSIYAVNDRVEAGGDNGAIFPSKSLSDASSSLRWLGATSFGSGGGNRTPRRSAYETELEPLQSTPQLGASERI